MDTNFSRFRRLEVSGCQRPGCQHGWVPRSRCVLTGREGLWGSAGPFVKALSPCMGAPPSGWKHFPKAPPPNVPGLGTGTRRQGAACVSTASLEGAPVGSGCERHAQGRAPVGRPPGRLPGLRDGCTGVAHTDASGLPAGVGMATSCPALSRLDLRVARHACAEVWVWGAFFPPEEPPACQLCQRKY